MVIKQIAAEQTWELRQRVMWPDKSIDYVKLTDDLSGIHYGLYVEQELVSVISLFINNNVIQFRKFATSSERQGEGCSTKLLNYVVSEAEKMGTKAIWCHARTEKVPFYRRFGLYEEGEEFERDGKRYVKMTRSFE
ncbi:MAG: GCN5-related N-acetyltransferase [Firmicutes bacterium]|nr:GCN5-related N-acetyltransferase [Bacillota bacterium]